MALNGLFVVDTTITSAALLDCVFHLFFTPLLDILWTGRVRSAYIGTTDSAKFVGLVDDDWPPIAGNNVSSGDATSTAGCALLLLTFG